MLKSQLKFWFRDHQKVLSYCYAWFLVFITPLSIPVALWQGYQGRVNTASIICFILMYCVSGLGITLGYHRLITHRAFKTTPHIKKALLIMGTFAMQGSPASWASLHIQHHRFADKAGDPHSPQQDKFWYSHCGWIFRGYNPNFRYYGKWLLKDKEVRHVSRYYLWYSNLGLLLPTLLLGAEGLLWGGVLRLFFSSHMTWSVNSICHHFGKRSYNTPDNSKNNFLIALFTFGEGWHNNHHRYLQKPYFGHHWYEIDIGKWILLLLQKGKWVWELKN